MLSLKHWESRHGEGKSASVQTPLRTPRTRSEWYQRAFRTTTYPAADRRAGDGTVSLGQITPYASAASLSDSEEPASSASSSSYKPSVIVSRTADTE